MEKKDNLPNETHVTGPPENVWIARNIDIDKNNFEESRRVLLTVYHSYIQNHAGYLIALVIGLIALLSASDGFFRTFGSLGFGGSVGIILLLIFYDLLRMAYWNNCVSQAIGLSENFALNLFDIVNPESESPYSKIFPAPETAILQIAIYKNLQCLAHDKRKSLRVRIVLILALKLHL